MKLNAYDINCWGEKNYPQAIDALKLNTQKHPDVANCWIAWVKRMHCRVIKKMRS